MLDRRVLLLVGVGAAGVYAARGFFTTPEVEFTRAAPPATAGIELRPSVSTAKVGIAVDLARVARRTETALKQRLAMGLDAVDPACLKRPSGQDCTGPRLEGAVSLAGPVEAAIVDGNARIRMPLELQVAQGTDRSRIETALTFTFKVKADYATGFEISRIDEAGIEAASGPHVRTLRLVESRLRPIALSAQDELRAVLAELPVAAATRGAWNALSQPIELGAGSGAWLKAWPEVAGPGVLASMDGKPMLQIPIAARLAIDSEPGGVPPRRSVVPGQVVTGGDAVVRVATPISLDMAKRAIHASFVEGGPHETRPDRFGPPVKVDIRQARLYPSVRQLGVELDIAASRFEGEVFRGKAHLVGRPVLDIQRRVVTLADIAFPLAPARDAAAIKAPPGAPRLATDPFAGKLAGAVRIDVSADVSDAVARTGGLLNRRLDDHLSLSARLSSAVPVGVEVSRDGLWLLTDVSGSLRFTYEGKGEPVAVAVGPAARNGEAASTQGDRKIARPELAAAAVVTAAAAASAAVTQTTVKPAAGGTAQSSPAIAAGMPSAANGAAVTAPGTSADAAVPAARSRVKPVVSRPVPKATARTAGAATRSANWVPFPSNN